MRCTHVSLLFVACKLRILQDRSTTSTGCALPPPHRHSVGGYRVPDAMVVLPLTLACGAPSWSASSALRLYWDEHHHRCECQQQRHHVKPRSGRGSSRIGWAPTELLGRGTIGWGRYPFSFIS
jgi:hypothetical protein